MMELLGAHGADVNAMWHGHFPIIFSPCESMGAALKWLLDHGTKPDLGDARQSAAGRPYPGTALDHLIALISDPETITRARSHLS
jgi:hypothetical protein